MGRLTEKLFLAIYVDDIVLVLNPSNHISLMKSELKKEILYERTRNCQKIDGIKNFVQ